MCVCFHSTRRSHSQSHFFTGSLSASALWRSSRDSHIDDRWYRCVRSDDYGAYTRSDTASDIDTNIRCELTSVVHGIADDFTHAIPDAHAVRESHAVAHTLAGHAHLDRDHGLWEVPEPG